MEGYLRDFGDFLELWAGDVPVGEELGDGGAHCEVHVQLAFALFQGKLATAEEGHDAVFIWGGKGGLYWGCYSKGIFA